MITFVTERTAHKKAERFNHKKTPFGLQKINNTNMSKKIEPCLKGHGVSIYI